MIRVYPLILSFYPKGINPGGGRDPAVGSCPGFDSLYLRDLCPSGRGWGWGDVMLRVYPLILSFGNCSLRCSTSRIPAVSTVTTDLLQ